MLYLCSGDQLHEGPAVRVPDQVNNQLFTGGQLMETVVPARRAAAGGGAGLDRLDTWDRMSQSSELA